MTIETTIARKLFDRAIAAGYSITVADECEVVLRRSRDAGEALKASGATGYDVFVFRDAEGARLGCVIGIHGNGEDYISDHTDNPAMCALVADLS